MWQKEIHSIQIVFGKNWRVIFENLFLGKRMKIISLMQIKWLALELHGTKSLIIAKFWQVLINDNNWRLEGFFFLFLIFLMTILFQFQVDVGATLRIRVPRFKHFSQNDYKPSNDVFIIWRNFNFLFVLLQLFLATFRHEMELKFFSTNRNLSCHVSTNHFNIIEIPSL